MKKTLIIILGCAALCGCSTVDDALYDKQAVTTPSSVRTNTVYVTNSVVIPAQTNIDGTLTPPLIKTIIQPRYEVEYTPAVTVTNLVTKASISNAIRVGESIPIPFAAPIALLFGWAYSAYAAVRNKKLAVALVQGIEAGRKILNETNEGKALDAKLKAELINHQEIGGVLNAASRLVNDFTSKTTNIP